MKNTATETVDEANINNADNDLNTTALSDLWTHRIGNTRTDLLANIINNDGKTSYNDTELSNDTITIHTEYATYTIPVEPDEDLNGNATIDVDNARDLRITCAVTGEAFTVTESTIPRSLTDMVYESIGRTWADQHT